MNSKIGIYSILVLGVMMLLIPAASIATAQKYDNYYEDEQYKKENKTDEPIIIIKNEPIQKKEKKMMKEPPMLLVKKDVLYCDNIANGEEPLTCFDIQDSGFAGPNSDRYVQECTLDNFACNKINEASFDMIVTDNIEFPGSEDGTKINFNGERFTITEEPNIGFEGQNEIINVLCQEAGFDGSIVIEGEFPPFLFCTVFEGECSGIVPDGELKECTVKNYLVEFEDL